MRYKKRIRLPWCGGLCVGEAFCFYIRLKSRNSPRRKTAEITRGFGFVFHWEYTSFFLYGKRVLDLIFYPFTLYMSEREETSIKNPLPSTTLEKGDIVWIVGEHQKVIQLNESENS